MAISRWSSTCSHKSNGRQQLTIIRTRPKILPSSCSCIHFGKEATMTIANKLRQYLDREGIRYDVTSHPRTATTSESAEAAHIPGGWMAKSVVVHHELGYAL